MEAKDLLRGIWIGLKDPVDLGALLGSWLDKDGNVHNHMVPRNGTIRLRWGSCHACDKAWGKGNQPVPAEPVGQEPITAPVQVLSPAPAPAPEGDRASLDLYL